MIEDMRHIRAFLAVARIGNFTRAAADLHVSQSALTVQIRQLEESLGVTLFDRGKRRAVLTNAGKDVLVPLEKILVDMEAVVSRTRQLTTLRRGIVTMAVLPSFAAQIVPRAIQRFKQLHPGVEIRIQDTVAQKIIEAVKQGEVDFGIGSRLRPDKELKAKLLKVDKLCAFVPNSHPLSRRASISLAELLASPVILTGKDSSVREIVEDGLKREKLALTIDYETNYMSTAVGLVQAGLGIAILPEAAAEMDRSGEISCIVIHAPSLSRKIEVLQRRDRALSPSASRMVEILKEVVGHSA
jgi:LysR family transcriptional regulator, carnitine catabolism transcriptional activator